MHSLLSTVGNTSKRDELGFARRDFLGQFGVGMLSCFLVAERIELVTRSARGGQAVRWSADGTGTYHVEVDDAARTEVGTTVRLVPRPDAEHWLAHDMVASLVEEFGSLLPVRVEVAGPDGARLFGTEELPWQRRAEEDADEYRARLLDYGRRVLELEPFDAIPVQVEVAGLTGVAFVLPGGMHPGERQAHRVYLKRMLVGTAVDGLLPEWAYFVRCVVNTSALRPTASRESLYEDETLLAVRDALGDQVRDWLLRLSATDPQRLETLLSVHRLGIKSVAVEDDELLRLVERWLPFETTGGVMPLRQFRRQHPTVLYTPDVDEFRQLTAVAEAQGIGLVNAGYAYDTQLMERLVALDGPQAARRVRPTELLAALQSPPPEAQAQLAAALEVAGTVLAEYDCEPLLRDFDPVSPPALLLHDPKAQRRQDTEQARKVSDDPLWTELLGQLIGGQGSEAAQRLVLNWRNPLVRRLVGPPDQRLTEMVVESLYLHALLQSRRPLRPQDTAALNRTFLDLIDRAVRS